jgi:predicted RNA binding protein YcfA (HicA-like mRNA interferase family)
MSALKLIDAKRLERMLFGLGFIKIRQKGSHAFYRYADGRTTTIPFHIAKDLSRPILRMILSEIKLSVEEYNELIK